MLPKTLKYGSKIESAYARAVRSNIQPQTTGPFNPGDTMIINIPCRQGLVLCAAESYLRFTVNIQNNTADNAFRLDSGGASGFLARVRTFHSSNQIEDIENYNMLSKMLYDIQLPHDAITGKMNLMTGTRADTVLKFPTITAAQGVDIVGEISAATVNTAIDATIATVNTNIKDALSTKGFSVQTVNSGDRLDFPAAGVSGIGAITPVTFCIPLISVCGLLSANNYLPLFAMSSAPLRLEITLVSNLLNACNVKLNTTPSTFTITDVEYIASMIELADPSISMINDSLGGQPLQFVFPSWRNYQNNAVLTQGASPAFNLPIAAKFSSVKSIFVSCRDMGLGKEAFFPFSSASRNISSYQFRIGPDVLPSKAPETLTEMFVECMKAIGSISDINQQPSIDKNSYQLVSSVNTAALLDGVGNVSNQYSGSFYIGIDLETYANSDKSQIFSGYNTNSSDVYCQLQYKTITGATAESARYDSYCCFDAVFVCENGTAYIRF